MFSRKTGNKFIGCSGWKDPDNPCPYKRGEDGKESMGPEVTTIPCPACGKFMVKKDGRFGTFYTCEAAPGCPTIMNEGPDGKPVVSTLPSKHPCPRCQKPLLLKFSKTGNRYVQCSDAKGCSYISDADESGAPIKPPDTGINCEKCGMPMVIKKSFRGPFLACTGYPKCRGTKAINAELKEKLKDILPKEEPKKAAASMPQIDIAEPCADCGAPMRLQKSRFGGRYFLSCTKYPACKGTRQPTSEQLAQIAAAGG
jgi:DNA topoisomerase-1